MFAHDFERTQVTLAFAADGAFVLDVTNDAAWLEHRLVPFERGPFSDRIVLFVDGREIRPDSVEYIGPPSSSRLEQSAVAGLEQAAVAGLEQSAVAGLDQSAVAGLEQSAVSGSLATYRMRGRVPLDARTLRWYYGLPIDPYPLTIRRADGRIVVEEIAGDAWSSSIDLTGQFHAPRISAPTAALAIILLLLIPIATRMRRAVRARNS